MRLISAEPVNALRVVLETDGGARCERLIDVEDLAGLGVVVSGLDDPPPPPARLSGKKGVHQSKTAKPKPAKPPKKTTRSKTVVERDGEGNVWVSQNELGRRMHVSGAGIFQFLKTHMAKLDPGVHVRDGEKGLLYCVESVMELREEIAAEKQRKRDVRFPPGSDETPLDRAMNASVA